MLRISSKTMRVVLFLLALCLMAGGWGVQVSAAEPAAAYDIEVSVQVEQADGSFAPGSGYGLSFVSAYAPDAVPSFVKADAQGIARFSTAYSGSYYVSLVGPHGDDPYQSYADAASLWEGMLWDPQPAYVQLSPSSPSQAIERQILQGDGLTGGIRFHKSYYAGQLEMYPAYYQDFTGDPTIDPEQMAQTYRFAMSTSRLEQSGPNVTGAVFVLSQKHWGPSPPPPPDLTEEAFWGGADVLFTMPAEQAVKFATDEEGWAYIDGLPTGGYVIHELSAPAGSLYVRNRAFEAFVAPTKSS